MAGIDIEVAKIADPQVRGAVEAAIADLRAETAFGLKYERQAGERVAMHGVRPRVGDKVTEKGGDRLLIVAEISSGTARCRSDDGEVELPVGDLVVTRECGEPVFPRLAAVEHVGAPTGKPSHVLIESENYHALELLTWTHARRIDCIYIDPPYNTGATSWMYNNRIVDQRDAYRSSKWLSMMERRLRLAAQLLKSDGVLIVTIDENELATLRLLLDEDRLFKGHDKHIVTIEHNPRGIQGDNFSVTNEFAIFVTPPGASVIERRRLPPDEVLSQPLRKWGADSERSTAKNCFYPIYFRDGRFDGAGEVLPDGEHPPARSVMHADGREEHWPLDTKGVERKWRYARATVDEIADRLVLKPGRNGTDVQLVNETQAQKTVWRGSRYAAFTHGTRLVTDVAGRKFPFPKSLYATMDCVDAVCRNRPDAVVLDFFGGSGTTTHAVALMNEIDGGRRTCITVTNNEVGTPEAKRLAAKGLTPADDEWQAEGICRSVTLPRLRNAILGVAADGVPLRGSWSTGQVVEEEVEIAIASLDFFDLRRLTASGARERFLAAAGVKGAAGKSANGYYVPVEGGSTTAYLFDPAMVDRFLRDAADAIEAGVGITSVMYAAPQLPQEDQALASALKKGLPRSRRRSDRTVPFAKPLAAELTYLRLGYLERSSIEAGRNLSDLLPCLWLMAGAFGSLPTVDADTAMLVSAECRFGLLVEPANFSSFAAALADAADVEWAFIVVDSEDHFADMVARLAGRVPAHRCVRLYRSFLNNFPVNTA